MKKTQCEVCLKDKWFVKQRKFYADQVSKAPITSLNKMCRSCYKKTLEIIKKI